jgi:hypothetical protein
MASRYRIHFHVWDRAGLFEFFVRSDEYLTNAFTLVEFAENGPELLSVLMKRPDPELEQRIREIDAIRSRGERKPVCDRVCARIQKLYGVLRSRR